MMKSIPILNFNARLCISLCILLGSFTFTFGQHTTQISAQLDAVNRLLHVEQSLTIKNESTDVWEEIILLDWSHALSSTSTPLAARFAEDFKNRFEFSNDNMKGGTQITYYDSTAVKKLYRIPTQQDIIKLELATPLPAGEQLQLDFKYAIKIAEDDFTGYGRSSNNDFNLRYWNLQPAVYSDGSWDYYSHKLLNDFYASRMDYNISLKVPTGYRVNSNIPTDYFVEQQQYNSYLLKGTDRPIARLHIYQGDATFKVYGLPEIDVITDIETSDVPMELKILHTDRIANFLKEKLGSYAFKELFISERYYKENPIYGLNSLPSFINPYPPGYTHELKLLKSMTRSWVHNGIRTHKRKDAWIQESIMVYLMMQYQDKYYPDLKLGGKLSDVWGLRGFYAARLKFNDQYPVLYMNTARLNLDQAIITPADSLLKFNQQLAIPYKAAIGLAYLNDYLQDDSVSKNIKSLYNPDRDSIIELDDFRNTMSNNASKNIDWFFNDYITSHKRMDWKIKRVRKTRDSIRVTIKNKSDHILPVPLYTLDNDSIIEKTWIDGIVNDTVITLSRKRANRVALNYERLIPEFNQRDNYKTLKKFPALDRPVEFRLFKDIEDPEKAQVFVIPDYGFNIYDGLTLGMRFYNGNILRKPLRYSIKPVYGLRSNKLIGSVGFSYRHPLEDRKERLYEIQYGLGFNTSSYEDDLLFRRGTASLSLRFRPADLRSNKKSAIRIRNVFVDRDDNILDPAEDPDYNVFSISYGSSDPNLTYLNSYRVGAEVSTDFTKLSYRKSYRKLYKDNRQLDLRLFAGAFLRNRTGANGDFFSFALDRPTDYLFDYNYYGRSEDSGIFSQQLIIAEGGFKSQLDTPFANQWIVTTNGSYSIWKYIFAYADAGLVKNRGDNPAFVYDSGIRLNLLQDFFELYFPIYSNNGWEIAQNNYDEKIRFIVTLDIKTFIGLFNRRWY